MSEENILEIEEKYQRSQALDEQLKIIEQQISELHQFSEALEFLRNNENKEILASIGKGVYVKSDMKEKEFFVDVGTGIIVKKKPEETKKVVEEQLRKLYEIKIQISTEIGGINKELIRFLEKSGKN